MSKTLEQLYEEAATLINRTIPEPWETAWLQVEIHGDESGGGGAGFYNTKNSPDVVRYFEFGPDYYAIWFDIWKFFREHGKQPWSTATFTLRHNGKFDIQFGYQDLLAENEYDRRLTWEKTHLGDREIRY